MAVVLAIIVILTSICAPPRPVLTSTSQPPSVRHVRISATVTNEQGQPLPGAVLVAAVTTEGLAARTDASGAAVLEGDIPSSATTVFVRLLPLSRLGDNQQSVLDKQRFDELINAYSFADRYSVALQPGVTEYALSVVGHPSIRVTGRAVNSNQAPVAVLVGQRFGVWITYSDPGTKRFEIGAVRKGQPAVLFLEDADNGLAAAVELSGTQTQADVELGDVLLTSPARNATVQLKLEGAAAFARGVDGGKRNFVSLISADGERMFVLPVGKDEWAMRSLVNVTNDVPLCPGTYYVCPGSLTTDRTCWNLRMLLRAGRAAELDAANAIKIVAQADQTTQHTIDAAAAATAIRAVAPDE